MGCISKTTVRPQPRSGYDLQPRVAASATLGTGGDISSNRNAVVRIRPPGKSNMPQSLSAVYIHLIFSTKNRQPFLRDQDMRMKLHSQIGGISKTIGCAPILTGGVEDHVHLLARFGRTITQAEWVKELKRVSNLWMKKEFEFSDFEWQGGYADFSVSESNLEQVKRYIANQDEHHRKIGFQDELRALLRRHRIEWDERYVWD